MKLAVIGNPENRRVQFCCDAAHLLGWPPPVVLAWQRVLDEPDGQWLDQLAAADALKIESPGENWGVKRALIHLGSGVAGRQAEIAAECGPVEDHGALRWLPEWYAGFTAVLGHLERHLHRLPHLRVASSPAAIACMMDKLQCRASMARAGVPQPPAIDLTDALDAPRAFIKTRYGSSASGVMAYRRSGTRQEVITSVDMVETPLGTRYYNSLKIRHYREPDAIQRLVTGMTAEGLFAEQWLPKASFAGGACDVRVVVIGGEARHAVVRVSNSPMTNLHLGNRRGDLAAFRQFIGDVAWERIREAAVAAVAAIGNPLYAGVDVLLSAGLRHVAVVDINAFGDLLPNVLDHGETTHQAILRQLATCALEVA